MAIILSFLNLSKKLKHHRNPWEFCFHYLCSPVGAVIQSNIKVDFLKIMLRFEMDIFSSFLNPFLKIKQIHNPC